MKHLLVLLSLLLMSLPAQATKPDAYTNEYGFADEIVDCGDFSVWDDAWVVENVKDFYDKDGNFIRSDMAITGYDDLYRFDDVEGVHLTGTAHIMGRVSFDGNGDMLWTQSGLAVAIIVPGYGPIFLDAGRLVFNMDDGWDLIFSAGKNHDWNFGDVEALCNYFDQD
jgi:hypothetical protein